MTNPATEALSVIVEREMPYPPEKIWRALTQPHLIEEWLMTNDFTPVVGHLFNFRADWGAVDCQDPTVDSAPICTKIETVVHDRLEVVLHQPLLDQVWLRERTPDLLRRIRYLAFDNDGERFDRGFAHWSILLSRSSRWSNRLCQNPAIWRVQSISGANAPSCAL